jgi:hypothetical protein
MAVAGAAVNLAPEISFEIVDTAIDRINRLVAANMEIQTFGGMEDGEIRVFEGGAWGGYSGSIVPLFTALARQGFDPVANLLKRWQSTEIRLMISLSIARDLLSGGGNSVGTFQPLRRVAPSIVIR